METQTTQTTQTKEKKETVIPKADERTLERCEVARFAAKNCGRTFVAAIFKTLLHQERVKIQVPSAGAKYLKFIEAHKILAFEGTALRNVAMIDVHAHYAHFDIPVRNDDGSVKPAVIRHYFINPDYRGETIVANIDIKEKTCLLTGKKTLIVDIVQLESSGAALSVEHEFRLSVPVTGEKNEVLIPGTDRCVKIAKINSQKISVTINDEKTKKERAELIAFIKNDHSPVPDNAKNN